MRSRSWGISRISFLRLSFNYLHVLLFSLFTLLEIVSLPNWKTPTFDRRLDVFHGDSLSRQLITKIYAGYLYVLGFVPPSTTIRLSHEIIPFRGLVDKISEKYINRH